MLFNCPLSSEKANRLVQLLDLSENSRVLDVGCGCGEFLIRVIESSGACGLGIDVDSQLIAKAFANATKRNSGSLFEFREADVQTENFDDESLDLAICIAATHAFGEGEKAYPNTLQSLTRIVRSGGQVLVGEGYWKQPPDKEYTKFVGEPVGIYRSHAGNIEYAEERGLATQFAAVSSDDEWDDFEWSHRRKIERQFAGNPELVDKLNRSRAWCNAYLRWGRATMGFGFYLFGRP